METNPRPLIQSTIHRDEFFRRVGTGIGAILLTRCLAGCSGEAHAQTVPGTVQKLDFTIRLNDKFNQNLLVKGGYTIINNVIVAQTKDGEFLAVSSACTHQKVQLVYKPIDNQFYCPLHLARFDATGKVIAGPATQPLIQYAIEPNLAGGTLRVHG